MATTYELIDSVVLGSDTASVTFSSIPGTYDDLIVVLSTRTDHASTHDTISLQLNGSSSNFTVRQLYGNGSTASSNTPSYQDAGLAVSATSTSNTFASGEIYFPNYAGSTNKSYSITSCTENNGTTAFNLAGAGLWADTSAISSIGFTSKSSSNFVTGSSFYLYAITKA